MKPYRVLFSVGLFVLPLFFNLPAQAVPVMPARVIDRPPEKDHNAVNDVYRLQYEFKKANLYSGPLHGFMDQATQDALHSYQRTYGLEKTDFPTEALFNHLKNRKSLDESLDLLEDARKKEQKIARQALLANPATRHFAQRPKPEHANALFDPAPCFAQPSPTCLLEAAIEGSKSLYEPASKDWVLNDIIKAQIDIDDLKGALKTVERIADERFVLIALQTVSLAQAQKRQLHTALETADLIPTRDLQLDALQQIALLFLEQGETEQATRLYDRIAKTLTHFVGPNERFFHEITFSKLEEQLYPTKGAQRLHRLLNEINQQPASAERRALRSSAVTQLSTLGYPQEALAYLSTPSSENPLQDHLLREIVIQLIIQKKYHQIDAIVQRISAPRVRSQLYANLAFDLRPQSNTQFNAYMDKSVRDLQQVKTAYHRDFSRKHIAEHYLRAFEQSGQEDDLQNAFDFVNDITHQRMHGVLIARLLDVGHNRPNLSAALRRQITRLHDATFQKIIGDYSKGWVLIERIEQQLNANQISLAKEAFEKALLFIAQVKNPQARTKLLIRFAILQHQLNTL